MLVQRVNKDDVAPEISKPGADRLIAGDPVHTTWNLEEVDGLYCGVWQSTPGKWRMNYTEWEYVYIHAGHSILTEDGGEPVHLMAGDSYMIRPGFKGTWEVVETTIKDYVIRE